MEVVNLNPMESFTWDGDSPYISIAIKSIEELPDQRHIGILHKKQSSRPSLLHLAWYHDLRDEVLGGVTNHGYYILVPKNLDSEKSRAIAGLCRRIAERKPRIPYGIVFDKSKFSEDGLLHLGDRSHGLTCATFIIAVFLSSGIELLNEDEWPSNRSDDIIWHDNIIAELKKTQQFYGIPDKHIDNIAGEKGCTRFRPEEVAGSFTSPNQPTSFEYARDIGCEIVKLVK